MKTTIEYVRSTAAYSHPAGSVAQTRTSPRADKICSPKTCLSLPECFTYRRSDLELCTLCDRFRIVKFGRDGLLHLIKQYVDHKVGAGSHRFATSRLHCRADSVRNRASSVRSPMSGTKHRRIGGEGEQRAGKKIVIAGT